MEDAPQVMNAQVFARFADEDLGKWEALVGCRVVHSERGQGEIRRVRRSDGGNILLEVAYESESQEIRTYPRETFCKAEFFPNVTLPSALDDVLAKIRDELEQKAAADWESAQVAAAAKALEEQQIVREVAAANEFAVLKTKYHANAHRSTSPSPLYSILLRIEAGQELSKEEQEWLGKKENGLHSTLALYHQKRFDQTPEPWSLVKASSSWRKASKPDKALALTEWLLDNTDPNEDKLQSAIFTTRGGAFRDKADLDEAEQCARQAIDSDDTSFYSYNLLGAIYFQRGEPDEGHLYFEEAVRLGAKPHDQENEMRSAVERSDPKKRRAVAEYLLRKDRVQYGWATRYLR